MTAACAPAGSGKTTLVRSWISTTGIGDSVAWVSARDGEIDPRRFWTSVICALRDTVPGWALTRPMAAVPGLDGWELAERLLADLGSVRDRIWLVIDNLHQLRSAEVLRQLEFFFTGSPPELRFVLMARKEPRLGLHRLRLEGELTEIRTTDLQFTLDEARELLATADVTLPESTLARLVERTEGWAAGLRLAALSLSGRSDAEKLAAGFSGSERMVTEYLRAEVLDQQPEEVRCLLRRCSILEEVSGPLADSLTGESGGDWILRELDAANAFVTSVDTDQSWFRFHPLFAEVLRFELRSTEPGSLPELHRAAAGWYARHGHPDEAIRHAQAAQDGLDEELLVALLNLSTNSGDRARTGDPDPPGPLSDSETRVLRYLPTNLSAPKIATELSVSVNTVRTHINHLYAKLGAHSRAEAVERARTAGLLSSSARQPWQRLASSAFRAREQDHRLWLL